MGNCPYCGAEMGFGVVICPNCGSQIAGDSLTDEGHQGDQLGDTSGDSNAPSQGADSISGDEGGVTGPDGPAPDQLADGWVADEATPNLPPTLDAGVPGSEIPISHGGGFQQQSPDDDSPAPDHITNPPEVDASVPGSEIPIGHGGGFQQQEPDDDSEAPPHITQTTRFDRPPDDIPQRPDPAIGIDDSGRMFSPQRRPLPWLAAILLIVIIALAGWYIWAGIDDGNGDKEPNGNGPPPPLEGLHVDRNNTIGFYTYEPNPGVGITVVVKNNDTETMSLDGYDVFVTIFIKEERRANDTHPLSGDLEAGKTTAYYINLDTGGFDLGDEILFSIMLRKDSGNTQVDLYTFKRTVE